MAILFDGTPQGAAGNYSGAQAFYNPPFPPTGNGGLAIPPNGGTTKADRIQIMSEATGRFGTGKYWRFNIHSGDQYQSQSGERCLLIRPDTNAEQPTGIPGGGSPPWGGVRYYGLSFRLDSGFTIPASWALLWQMKMGQHGLSPYAAINIRTPNNGSVGAVGASSPIEVQCRIDGGPFNTSPTLAFDPTYKLRTATPNFISNATKSVWYDVIIYQKFAKDLTGAAAVSWKLATDSTWNTLQLVTNDWVGQWNKADGLMNDATTTSQGFYRGPTAATNTIDIAGEWVAETFDDIANGVFGAPLAPPDQPPDLVSGRTRIGLDSYETMTATNPDFKRVMKRNIGANVTATVHEAYALILASTAGASHHKLVVYEDSSGSPGALAGSGDEATAPDDAALAWYDVSPTTPFDVDSGATGNIFFGLHSGDQIASTGRKNVTNGLWTNADTYSDGATDPFGAPNSANTEMAIVLDYVLATADTTDPAVIDAAANQLTLTITYDELLDETSIPAESAYTVTRNAVAMTVTGVSVADQNVVLSLTGTSIAQGNTVLVSYTPPASNKIKDLAGNLAASLSSLAVTATGEPPLVIRDAPTGTARPAGSRPSASRPTGTDRPTGTQP